VPSCLAEFPFRLFVFDILRLDGEDITGQPFIVRRERLSEIASCTESSVIRFPGSWTDVDPAQVLATSAELGFEDVVCEHLDSRYTPPGASARVGGLCPDPEP
jgi:bifunctional non-homologous end joining protein LigD